jgi:hypothetical protein
VREDETELEADMAHTCVCGLARRAGPIYNAACCMGLKQINTFQDVICYAHATMPFAVKVLLLFITGGNTAAWWSLPTVHQLISPTIF